MTWCPAVRQTVYYLDFPDLDLESGQVLEDLKVVRLVLEGVQVALDGLGVVALGAVEKAVHVPADVAVVTAAAAVVVVVLGVFLLVTAVEITYPYIFLNVFMTEFFQISNGWR